MFIDEISLKNPIPDNRYYKELGVVKSLSQAGSLSLSKPVTFLVGENGIGKSTLIEAIAVACGLNAEGGTQNFRLNTYSSHSDLHKFIRISKSYYNPQTKYFLRAESFYNVASYIEELDNSPAFSPPIKNSYGGKSLHEQSHGESFLSLVENRFSPNGLYILDEPEAALSPTGIMRLMVNIHRLVNENCQFIISTHSPMLITMRDSEIFELTDRNIKSVRYDQTSHYNITKEFLDNPERMQHYLFDE